MFDRLRLVELDKNVLEPVFLYFSIFQAGNTTYVLGM